MVSGRETRQTTVDIAAGRAEAKRRAEQVIETYGSRYSEHERKAVFDAIYRRELDRLRDQVADELRPSYREELAAEAVKNPAEAGAAADRLEAHFAQTMTGL